jgi:hypothetical protein
MADYTLKDLVDTTLAGLRMSCKAVGITLQMVSSYKTVDDSPSPWGKGRGEGERLFNCIVPAKRALVISFAPIIVLNPQAVKCSIFVGSIQSKLDFLSQ